MEIKINKKGLSTIGIFPFIFYFFFIAIFLGITILIFNSVSEGLDHDVYIGQVNLAEINNQTFRQFEIALTDKADMLGIVLLLGMCLMLFMNAFLTGRNYPKLFMIIDIFIIIFAFILAVYISQIYETFINSTDILTDIYINNIPNASKFILNLPLIVSTLGVIIMILTYSQMNRKEREANVLGI